MNQIKKDLERQITRKLQLCSEELFEMGCLRHWSERGRTRLLPMCAPQARPTTMSDPSNWYDPICWTIRDMIYDIALEIDMARVLHDHRLDPPFEDRFRDLRAEVDLFEELCRQRAAVSSSSSPCAETPTGSPPPPPAGPRGYAPDPIAGRPKTTCLLLPEAQANF